MTTDPSEGVSHGVQLNEVGSTTTHVKLSDVLACARKSGACNYIMVQNGTCRPADIYRLTGMRVQTSITH